MNGANAFVVSDLDGMARHAGLARCAPKVLTDSTWLLARCATYQFASLDLDIGGASVGISAPADERDATVAAAVSELGDLAANGLVLDAGRGLTDGDLAPLHDVDGRPPEYTEQRPELTGRGAAAAAGCVRPLDGATVVVESLDATSVAFAHEAVRHGARLVGVGIGGTGIMDPTGIDPTSLQRVLDGPAGASPDDLGLSGSQVTVGELAAAGVDVLAIGSKPGAIDHTAAATITASVVVPTAWVPVTTRALAVLTRAGITVLADFVTLAGAIPASGLVDQPVEAGAAGDAAAQLVATVTHEVLASVNEQWPNPVLAACARAEASLLARGHELPVSRPLG